jgi:hypothetical protein
MKDKVQIFVNSFSFIFSGVSHEDLLGQLFPMGQEGEKGRYTGNQTSPAPETGWAGRLGPTGPVGPRRRFAPDFSPECSFSTSFFGQKNLREV